jgi:hypothetical protein
MMMDALIPQLQLRMVLQLVSFFCLGPGSLLFRALLWHKLLLPWAGQPVCLRLARQLSYQCVRVPGVRRSAPATCSHPCITPPPLLPNGIPNASSPLCIPGLSSSAFPLGRLGSHEWPLFCKQCACELSPPEKTHSQDVPVK